MPPVALESLEEKAQSQVVGVDSTGLAPEAEAKEESTKAPEANGIKTKAFPMLEVARHTSRRSAWLVVHGKVYDVTEYLDEHPGGDDILLDSSGRDATREFEDVGHSDGARAELDRLYIGDLREPTEEELAAAPEDLKHPTGSESSILQTILKWALPIALIVIAYFLRSASSK